VSCSRSIRGLRKSDPVTSRGEARPGASHIHPTRDVDPGWIDASLGRAGDGDPIAAK
jgi:hypothetical protein